MATCEVKERRATKAPKLPEGVYPESIIISPRLKHHQTFIILHGRGSFAARFAPPLLIKTSSSDETLQSAFPHAKFIFPTACRSRATSYKNKLTHQWMDSWIGDNRTAYQDLMIDGLHKSCDYIHSILNQESAIVGEQNVVLWGLSQGGATTLSSVLTWDRKPLAAAVVMCGYLPFWNRVQDIALGKESVQEEIFDTEDLFYHSDDEDTNDNKNNCIEESKDLAMQAVTFFRNEIEMNHKTGTAFKEIPIFLGHGTEDEKVPLRQARNAKLGMDLIGADAKIVEYQGLGHWYSAEMLDDIFKFLKEKLNIKE